MIGLSDEESYRDLFDNAHDCIQLVSLDGKILFVNQSWLNTMGYELYEIEGQLIFDFIHEDDRTAYITYRTEILKGFTPDRGLVVRYLNKNSEILYLEGFLSLRHIEGRAVCLRGIFRDITARLENEGRLREREQNWEQLLIHAPDAVIVIDSDSKIQFWNPAAEKLFGWTMTEALNKPLAEFIIPEQYRNAHHQGMTRFIATGETHVLNKTIEITALNKAGEEFYISLTISTTTLNGKRAFISFIRDIRQRKKNEAALEKQRQQLEISNRQLEQFAHVASHDMKEPVRKIMLFIERLEKEYSKLLPADAVNYIVKIKSAGKRLQKMVEGLLEDAVAGSIEKEKAPHDLNRIISEIKEDLDLVIQQKNATISYADLPFVLGIDFLLYQLFYNLINNSLKFSRPGVPVRIQITAEDIPQAGGGNILPDAPNGYTQIKVIDNGIGFEQAYAAKIFKTFTRLHNPNQFEGTGLGLSLCETIMERHHGSIKAEGKPNEGATITMLFPK